MNLRCTIGRHKWHDVPFMKPPEGLSRDEVSLHIREYSSKWRWKYCTECGAQREFCGPYTGWQKRLCLSAAQLKLYNEAEAKGNTFG